MDAQTPDADAHPQEPLTAAEPPAVADAPPVTGEPPAQSPRLRRRRRRLILPLLLMALLVAALVVTIVDDVHTHTTAFTTQNKLNASRSAVASLNDAVSSQQVQIDDIGAKLDSDQAILTAAPSISVVSSAFTGSCTERGCTMSATVINTGSAGSGIVQFEINPVGQPANTLAECSASVGPLSRGQTQTVSCSAGSAKLQDYFTSTANAKVVFQTNVVDT